ncbi:unnamed protein product [Trifolium pratense]|uniref:Uncharacterized protein n=1 Tax=Trifolium pratense TaxID=57577 RepID=A0ACB0IMM5_TRIPR|nr:unnamed protein product [Trifolium pratense]
MGEEEFIDNALLIDHYSSSGEVLVEEPFRRTAIYFPVEMYFVHNKIESWSTKWIFLRIFSFVCFLVTVLSLVGSLEGIISEKLS